jgi:hypothetical protein
VVSIEINGELKEPQDQLALANSWWGLSATAHDEPKMFYQRRARYWYLKGIANSQEADRPQLRQQFADRIHATPSQAGVVHIVSRVGGSESVDIYSDEVQWQSSRRGTTGNKINYVSLGDFKADGLQVVKNSGATWLMPDTVDFSTAHLVVDRKSNRQGQATLHIADDHVRVVLAHPRLGASEMEVTVNFTAQP